MALAVPDAFQDEAAWFAVAYFVVRILNPALYMWGSAATAGQLRAIAAAFAGFSSRPVSRSPAAPVDAVTTACLGVGGVARHRRRGDADRRAGSSGTSRRRTSPSASRSSSSSRSGESIVAIGIATTSSICDATYADLRPRRLPAGVAALGWADFDFTAVAAERGRSIARPPGCVAPSRGTSSHVLPLPRAVLHLSSMRSRRKKALEHPLDPLSEAGRWALGVAVFLCGFALMRFRLPSAGSPERLAAAGWRSRSGRFGRAGRDHHARHRDRAVPVLSGGLEPARLRDFRASMRSAQALALLLEIRQEHAKQVVEGLPLRQVERAKDALRSARCATTASSTTAVPFAVTHERAPPVARIGTRRSTRPATPAYAAVDA